MKKKRILNNQKGAIAVIFAILLIVLIGFTALGIDTGRWYAAREKAQEACDAAVLAGIQAYGITNWKSLAEDVASENFPQGYLGFQLFQNNFVGQSVSEVRVDGTISATASTFFGGVIGIDTVGVCVSCAAGRVPFEIMLVLDRSGSIGTALPIIQDAAKSFVDNFAETHQVDKMGLISFATGVTVDFPLSTNFVGSDNIKNAIDGITIAPKPSTDRDTNMEDAIDQADDDTDRAGNATTTFTKYASNIPESERVKQFLIFFTDGVARSFRGEFTRDGQEINHPYGAVIPDPMNQGWEDAPLLLDPCSGESIGVFKPTGDGLSENQTSCSNPNTKWHVFDGVYNSEYEEDEDDYSIDGYSSPYCDIPKGALVNYVCDTAEKMTIYHARKLKEQGIIIYCIGAGSAKGEFLKKIADTEDHVFEDPTYEDLTAIFNEIANDIKGQVYLQ